MSSKNSKSSSTCVPEQKQDLIKQKIASAEDIDKITAFRGVHAHFSESKKSRKVSGGKKNASMPTLEIRQAMQQAKSAYETMLDIQEKLNQAYNEIMKNPL